MKLIHVATISLLIFASLRLDAAAVPVDAAGYREGAVSVGVEAETLSVEWRDEANEPWRAVFSLDPEKPLIESVSAGDRRILEGGRPYYNAETGKRRRGWNAFFDLPPSHPEGTRPAPGKFSLSAVAVRSVGERVELSFDGLEMGVFSGGIVYTIFPGSRLIKQEAVVRTYQANTAYYYDAGLEFAAPADQRPGRNMETEVAYYDQAGSFVERVENGFEPERTPVKVRYRTLAVDTDGGSVAAFPPPHQYFFPRDFTSNLGYLWQRVWRGQVGLGIRQIRDTGWQFYPWMNAPPGTEQRMGIFFLLSKGSPREVLDEVLAYTNRDRFPALPGYKTVSPHWHVAYTVQAMEKGTDWIPPFKPVLKAMGVDAAIIMDFHGDGHPRDLTDLRLQELDAYFQNLREQSNEDFLLIPSEEANVHYGGHWAVTFPKPVYWFMNRPDGGAYKTTHPKYGTVYSVANEEEMLNLIREEGGWAYQTHPRTKGSTGYPDRTRDKEYFRDPSYFGVGWKAMPSDPSLSYLGERSFDTLDDMNNWGMPKKLIGEADLFQFDASHELYAHMNINYVQAERLPSFEEYGELLKPITAGNFFTTTGEVLLPRVEISTTSSDHIQVSADVRWTFPLGHAEIVWGDGEATHHVEIPLTDTRGFGEESFHWTVPAPGWKWARLAVWDVAANGAFVNPTRREE
jgi:hypothetical protein